MPFDLVAIDDAAVSGIAIGVCAGIHLVEEEQARQVESFRVVGGDGAKFTLESGLVWLAAAWKLEGCCRRSQRYCCWTSV